MSAEDFIIAIESFDLKEVEKSTKSDLHNHFMLGSRKGAMENWLEKKIINPPTRFRVFDDFDRYLTEAFDEVMKYPGFFEYCANATFLQAKTDGVKVLQTSVDSRFYNPVVHNGTGIIEIIETSRHNTIPEILFVPQLGMDRRYDFKKLIYETEAFLDTGYFRSIDLYGDEMYRDIKRFVPVYKKAKNMGLMLTAHAGEYGTADDVRRSVETLELQQVQHGIAAAESKEVMKWLAENKIILNICPTSNVVLHRVASLQSHPIRLLYDFGVKVTINTDDLMVFNQSVSEEFLNLYKAGVFSAAELEQIRQNGLNAFSS